MAVARKYKYLSKKPPKERRMLPELAVNFAVGVLSGATANSLPPIWAWLKEHLPEAILRLEKDHKAPKYQLTLRVGIKELLENNPELKKELEALVKKAQEETGNTGKGHVANVYGNRNITTQVSGSNITTQVSGSNNTTGPAVSGNGNFVTGSGGIKNSGNTASGFGRISINTPSKSS
jgi:hypothetical protein